jgi:hypothetical protein
MKFHFSGGKAVVKVVISVAALAVLSGCAGMTPTQKTERGFTIFDVQSPTIDRNRLLSDITSAVQANVSRANVNRDIPPVELPDKPSRMRMVDPLANSQIGALLAAQGGSTRMPVCDQPLMTITAKDTSGSAYGDVIDFFLCVVGYKAGVQVNIHVTHVERTGGFSINTLSGTLTKSIAGGWSQYIPRTINAVKKALETQGPVTIVDSYIPDSFKGAFSDEVDSLKAQK